MICPNCQTSNADDAKFCEHCGFTLERTCPNCGKTNSLGAKFCRNCGYRFGEPQPASTALPPEAPRVDLHMPQPLARKLEAARVDRAMQGERRIVTVLFCDVKGSTAMAEQLDPEEWAEIMNAAFEHLMQPVYRYEGTVARLMGDAILAFFGAPIAHEDDPQRAILAGLGIVESIQSFRERMKQQRGLDFNVRIGINTGLVVVGDIGSDLKVEYTAMGDAVNVAARMEQTAQPGSVQISASTYRLVAPIFDVETLGGIEVKGKSEPVAAYRVLRAKATPGRMRGIEGLDSPLVGREREMAALRAALAGLGEGRGAIVSLIGEAGLGKSRLIAEARADATAEGRRQTAEIEPATGHGSPSTVWLEGRSLSYETTTPYAPFIDLFNKYFDLNGEMSDAQKYDTIRSRVAQVAAEQVQDIAPFVATLLGIAFGGEDAERVRYLEPPQRREKIFHAVSSFIERIATTQALVLVCEDLHWTDATSLDLLLQLAPISARAPLLLIAVFRAQRQEPSWQFHEAMQRDFAHMYHTLTLDPLDESHARELVANLLHVEDLPEKVRALILRKAEGNPFFVEEVIRSLLDMRLVVRENSHWRATREIENIAVPDTLAGVITARLDRLDDDAKRAAQTAAVIGREFPMNTLADVFDAKYVLDPALNQLQRRELVREKSRIPQRTFLFKHALTQETAYASMLLRTRRELHRRVAESLERSEPERVNDIARHFVEAQENVRALPYLVTAGDRAAHAYATREAISYYQKALDILQSVDDIALARRAYEGMGGTLTLANDLPRAVQTYETMMQIGQAHDDVPMQVSALNKLSMLLALRMGQFPDAEKRLADAERLAREVHDKQGLSELFTIRCMLCTASADFDGVVRYMGESLEIGRELNIIEQMAMGFGHIANTLGYMLRFEESYHNAQESLRLARQAGDRLHEAAMLAANIPFYFLSKGKLDTAGEFAEAGVNLAVQIGYAMAEADGALVLGDIARRRGEYERATSQFQRSASVAQNGGIAWDTTLAQCALATTHLEISPALADQARSHHAQAMQLLELPPSLMMAASVWDELGAYHLALGELDRASEYYQKALSQPSVTMYVERTRALLGAAQVALARGQTPEAAASVDLARQFAEDHALQHEQPSHMLMQAHVSVARGQLESALEQFALAESSALTMTMRPIVLQARMGAAQTLAQLGRDDDAERKRADATATMDEIASFFADAWLRSAFVAHANTMLKVPAA